MLVSRGQRDWNICYLSTPSSPRSSLGTLNLPSSFPQACGSIEQTIPLSHRAFR